MEISSLVLADDIVVFWKISKHKMLSLKNSFRTKNKKSRKIQCSDKECHKEDKITIFVVSTQLQLISNQRVQRKQSNLPKLIDLN